MKILLKVLIFFFVNAVGFSIGPTLIGLSVFWLQLIEVSEENLAGAEFINSFMLSMSITWFVCMIFSFASFFLSGLWKKIFLLCPIFIPLIFGLYKLNAFI